MSDDPLALASEFPAVTRADWLGAVGKVLNGASLQDALVKRNHDGVAVHPLYTADERPAAQMPELGGRNWHIRTAYDVSDAIAANAAILEDLECGATAITLGFGDGAPNSVDDLDSLLDGVFLDMAPVALEAGAAFRPAAELLQALWERRGIAPEKALGAFNADPIGISAQSIADAAELARETAGKYPGVTSIAVDTHRYHAAGASEAQEVAAGLATGVAYLRAMEAVGLAPEAAARQIVFTLAADADLFLTIAKFRAFRRGWASVLAACRVAGPAPARIEAVTAWRMMTRTDPWVNMLRTTAAAFAAGVAGADAILVRPFDAASKAPDGFSRRIARNIQIILQEESGLGQVIDPAAGSYAIERLTADLADAAWAAFQAIESAGGMAPALESGFVQGEIAKARAALEADVATRRRGITGTSRFPNLDEPALAPLASSAPPRLSEPFESLRARGRPKIFLATLGTQAQFGPRATWAQNLFAAGGIEAITGPGGTDPAEIAAAFSKSGAKLAVLCGPDALYADHLVPVAEALKAAGAARLSMAGNPGSHEEVCRKAGVDEFLFEGVNVLDALGRAWEAMS